MNKFKPSVAIVLDGFGINKKYEGNAIWLANTPTLDYFAKNFPLASLKAHGEEVGLAKNQVSGSEVGHINIGSGRLIKQDSLIISNTIDNGSFFKNEALLKAINHAKKNNSSLHVMGLMSDDDSPHSNYKHYKAIIKLAKENKIKKLFLHFFSDGRDSPPYSAKLIYQKWKEVLEFYQIGQVATLSGRFYAMDRIKNWLRLKKAYDCIVNKKGVYAKSVEEAIETSYNLDKTDEYLEPTVILDKSDNPIGKVKDNDAFIFFNLRSDRARQFTKLFVKEHEDEFILPSPRLKNIVFTTLTDFGPRINIEVAFDGHFIDQTLPQIIKNRRQLYISESEKFSHITYFLNGKRSYALNHESRMMIPSPKVDSYAETPEMSAGIITKIVTEYLKKEAFDFIFINFANPDMLGHTGNLKATIKGIEYLDRCIKKIYHEIYKNSGNLFIFSDHGNADEMINEKTKAIITFHSKNPVPFMLINKKPNKKLAKDGKLANITPTILKVMDLEIPHIMEKPLI